MGLNDAVVIDADRLAERILGDLETTIDVTAQSACEVESDRKRQILAVQCLQQCSSLRSASERHQDLLADKRFVGSAYR